MKKLVSLVGLFLLTSILVFSVTCAPRTPERAIMENDLKYIEKGELFEANNGMLYVVLFNSKGEGAYIGYKAIRGDRQKGVPMGMSGWVRRIIRKTDPNYNLFCVKFVNQI